MYNKFLLFLAIIILFCTPLYTSAQEVHLSKEKRELIHHETKGDEYLPNSHRNKKTSPSYRYQRTSSATLTGSGIFTTQVNIDSNGQNILFDAGNEPSIAVNPLNPAQIVIGWRQFDNVLSNFRQAGWSYSSDTGQTWTFPGLIEAGTFRSDPVLDFDETGTFYYNSLTNTPDFFCKVFRSTNGGSTWDNGEDAAGGDKQWMTVDRSGGIGNGNIYSSWSSFYSTCMPGFYTRSTNGGNTFDSCEVIDGDPYWITMAVGNAGELYVAGGNDNTDSLVIAKSFNAQIPGAIVSWEPPVPIFMDGFLNGWLNVNPNGLLGQVNVDIDRTNGIGQGNVYVAASLNRISNNDPGDVMFSRSTDGGLTWDVPVQINDDNSVTNTQWFTTMSVAPNGRIDMVWLDTREDNFGLDSSALYYSYSLDQGTTWSVNEKMSALFDPHVGYPNQLKMGDYFDMTSDSSGAHLAWSNTLNGEEDVYYSYITPPVSTGINENLTATDYLIYPNPTVDLITIKGAVERIEIYNAIGQMVLVRNLTGMINHIDCTSLAPSIYFIKVASKNGQTDMSKLVKE